MRWTYNVTYKVCDKKSKTIYEKQIGEFSSDVYLQQEVSRIISIYLCNKNRIRNYYDVTVTWPYALQNEKDRIFQVGVIENNKEDNIIVKWTQCIVDGPCDFNIQSAADNFDVDSWRIVFREINKENVHLYIKKERIEYKFKKFIVPRKKHVLCDLNLPI